MSKAYYNEIDPLAAEWLRNLIAAGLIAPGDVDTRSITEVRPDDIKGYTQAHLFAGIGGWSLAFRLAGIPDTTPIWTGSCPCQPFSVAGKGAAQKDKRHLWPDMFRLIKECRPVLCFGEQVAAAIGHSWLDGVSADLEGEEYAVGAAVLGAHSVNAPHIRQRLYWGADHHENTGRRNPGTVFEPQTHILRSEEPQVDGSELGGNCVVGGLPNAQYGRPTGKERGAESGAQGTGTVCGVGDFESRGFGINRSASGGGGHPDESGATDWTDYAIVACTDGKYRRVPAAVEPEVLGLANGVPAGMGRPCSNRFPLAPKTKGRAGRLKGYGNAIVPQVAAEFISAYLETLS